MHGLRSHTERVRMRRVHAHVPVRAAEAHQLMVQRIPSIADVFCSLIHTTLLGICWGFCLASSQAFINARCLSRRNRLAVHLHPRLLQAGLNNFVLRLPQTRGFCTLHGTAVAARVGSELLRVRCYHFFPELRRRPRAGQLCPDATC